jgi:hypothetical protein
MLLLQPGLQPTCVALLDTLAGTILKMSLGCQLSCQAVQSWGGAGSPMSHTSRTCCRSR